MMKLMTGPYYPGLEDALLRRLSEGRGGPLEPVAIVAPSARIRDHLQIQMARRGHSALNLHFHTLSSFVTSLMEEEAADKSRVSSDPLLFDTLIRFLVKERKPFSDLEDLAVPQGFPPAVRGTIRDLTDAGVPRGAGNPLKELVREKWISRDADVGPVLELLDLYNEFHAEVDRLKLRPRWALQQEAIRLAPGSPWLRRFKGILFYGFYDLTGLQRDFVEAVVKNHESEWYLPFVKDNPATRFARPFWEWLVGLASETIDCPPAPVEKKCVRAFNVSGLRDEAWAIAGEIWRLRLRDNVPFHEMAVVVRSKDRLTRDIPAVFEERGIPFHSSVRTTLIKHPEMRSALDRLRADVDSRMARKTFSSWVRWAQTMLIDASASPLLTDPLASLVGFDELGRNVSGSEFLEVLEARWREADYPGEPEVPAGVALHHAESVRGLRYRVVFLAGAEERVFPRVIREDPFLRDDARRLLNQIGYRISEKLSALEEEELLFHLIEQAAAERFAVVYQRSDDDGRIVGESPFVRAWAAKNDFNLEKDAEKIPRPTLPKIRASDAAGLNAREIVLRYLHRNDEENALAFLECLRLDSGPLRRGLDVQRRLNQFDRPHSWDAMIGPLTDADLFPSNRVSASAMESYGLCPFRFFAEKMLELKPVDKEIDWESLDAIIQGKIVHEFLEAFFKKITSNGDKPVPARFPEKEFYALFDAYIPADPRSKGPTAELTKELNIPPLLWSALRDRIRHDLHFYLEHDLQALRTSGFSPRHFEREVTAELSEPLDGVRWHGFIDRMDQNNGHVRIIDYKSGRVPDRLISTEAVRGLKAQPPLYMLMAQAYFKSRGKKVESIEFSYHKVLGEANRKDLLFGEWEKWRDEMARTIRFQLDSMRRGVFLPMPGDICDRCDVAPACRKHHSLSVYRSRQGPGEKLWEIRTQGKKR